MVAMAEAFQGLIVQIHMGDVLASRNHLALNFPVKVGTSTVRAVMLVKCQTYR